MSASRGDAVSGYLPPFEGVSGAKVYKDNLKSQVITGTITSANVVIEVSHQLGLTPSIVLVTPSLTKAQAASAGVNVALADQTSATTTSKFYVAGNQVGVKYKAFLLV